MLSEAGFMLSEAGFMLSEAGVMLSEAKHLRGLPRDPSLRSG
jgi:hypothetical protein